MSFFVVFFTWIIVIDPNIKPLHVTSMLIKSDLIQKTKKLSLVSFYLKKNLQFIQYYLKHYGVQCHAQRLFDTEVDRSTSAAQLPTATPYTHILTHSDQFTILKI